MALFEPLARMTIGTGSNVWSCPDSATLRRRIAAPRGSHRRFVALPSPTHALWRARSPIPPRAESVATKHPSFQERHDVRLADPATAPAHEAGDGLQGDHHAFRPGAVHETAEDDRRNALAELSAKFTWLRTRKVEESAAGGRPSIAKCAAETWPPCTTQSPAKQ